MPNNRLLKIALRIFYKNIKFIIHFFSFLALNLNTEIENMSSFKEGMNYNFYSSFAFQKL